MLNTICFPFDCSRVSAPDECRSYLLAEDKSVCFESFVGILMHRYNLFIGHPFDGDYVFFSDWMKRHYEDTLALFNFLSEIESFDDPLEKWLHLAFENNLMRRKLLEQPVINWYKGAYSTWFDHLLYLDQDVNCSDVVHCIDQGKDLWHFLSCDDERVDWDCIDHIFSRLEELLGIDYSIIYDRWVCRDLHIDNNVTLDEPMIYS